MYVPTPEEKIRMLLLCMAADTRTNREEPLYSIYCMVYCAYYEYVHTYCVVYSTPWHEMYGGEYKCKVPNRVGKEGKEDRTVQAW